ncbi:helix-turn-helix domain-containing protein, partial [Amycolatopsis pigmentata]
MCERKFKASLGKPPVMSRDFWQSDRFREAFESQDMGKVFRAFRTDERHKEHYGRNGIHQTWLASWLGMTQSQLSRIEQGKSSTDSLQVLRRWAKVLSIPPELLWFDFPGQKRQRVSSRKPRDRLTERLQGKDVQSIESSHVRHPVDGRLMARVDGS